MTLIRPLFAGILIMALCTCCMPAGAILQQFTYRGYVSSSDPGTGNITLLATHTWRCSYDNNTAHCGWGAISPIPVTGKVPSAEVFTVVRPGKVVEASSLGIPGGHWTGIGLLAPVYEEGGYVTTALFGNPESLPAPFPCGYVVRAVTNPDCEHCTGSTCPALGADTTILRNGNERWNGTLLPGKEYQYRDPIDQSSVYIRFVSGTASSNRCPNATGIFTGPQPVSIFIIRVDKPGLSPGFASRNGFLSILSFPSGATVFMNGEQKGETQLAISNLNPGTYTLVLKKEGYSPWEKTVAIQNTGRMMVTATLEPLYGSLRIHSSPSQALILINGEEAGSTPKVIKSLSPGEYSITLSKTGYLTANRTTKVSAGQEKLLYVALSPELPLFV
jgi:hypothetical protein